MCTFGFGTGPHQNSHIIFRVSRGYMVGLICLGHVYFFGVATGPHGSKRYTPVSQYPFRGPRATPHFQKPAKHEHGSGGGRLLTADCAPASWMPVAGAGGSRRRAFLALPFFIALASKASSRCFGSQEMPARLAILQSATAPPALGACKGAAS